ncbi:MAG: hypothetical protein M1817_006810 [Caeruleum heppii]|nr:MAG: hypothetical protein M1817_006810 [Caeruleum heppii]
MPKKITLKVKSKEKSSMEGSSPSVRKSPRKLASKIPAGDEIIPSVETAPKKGIEKTDTGSVSSVPDTSRKKRNRKPRPARKKANTNSDTTATATSTTRTTPSKKAATNALPWTPQQDQIVIDASLRGETYNMIAARLNKRFNISRTGNSVEQHIGRLMEVDRKQLMLPRNWRGGSSAAVVTNGEDEDREEWTLGEDIELVQWKTNGCVGLSGEVFAEERSREGMRKRVGDLEEAAESVTAAEMVHIRQGAKECFLPAPQRPLFSKSPSTSRSTSANASPSRAPAPAPISPRPSPPQSPEKPSITTPPPTSPAPPSPTLSHSPRSFSSTSSFPRPLCRNPRHINWQAICRATCFFTDNYDLTPSDCMAAQMYEWARERDGAVKNHPGWVEWRVSRSGWGAWVGVDLSTWGEDEDEDDEDEEMEMDGEEEGGEEE